MPDTTIHAKVDTARPYGRVPSPAGAVLVTPAAELEHDVGVGVGVGFFAGFALMGLAVTGVGTIDVGGLLALGAASGLGGSMLGGYIGVAAGDQPLAVHEHLAAAALEPGEVLVAVCSHGHPDAVRRILQGHGGTLRPAEAT